MKTSTTILIVLGGVAVLGIGYYMVKKKDTSPTVVYTGANANGMAANGTNEYDSINMGLSTLGSVIGSLANAGVFSSSNQNTTGYDENPTASALYSIRAKQ